MFQFNHYNFNVFDLQKSLDFYHEALGLYVDREKVVGEGDDAFKLCYLTDGVSNFHLELTWLAGRKTPYNLGDCEYHLAFTVGDMEKAHAKHEKMGCIAYENKAMGIYFITDPDGYWIEIIPQKKKQ